LLFGDHVPVPVDSGRFGLHGAGGLLDRVRSFAAARSVPRVQLDGSETREETTTTDVITIHENSALLLPAALGPPTDSDASLRFEFHLRPAKANHSHTPIKTGNAMTNSTLKSS
jgi:hypothetical protein